MKRRLLSNRKEPKTEIVTSGRIQDNSRRANFTGSIFCQIFPIPRKIKENSVCCANSGGSKISQRGARTRKFGVKTYYLTRFLPKTLAPVADPGGGRGGHGPPRPRENK